MKKLLLLSLAFVFVWATPILAQENKEDAKVLRVAVNAIEPPMEFFNENNELDGFSVDYMNALGEEIGYKIEPINTGWDVILTGLINKEYDAIFSSATITEERKKIVDFSDPYFTVRQAILVPDNSSIQTAEDLKGKKVGAKIFSTGSFAAARLTGTEAATYDMMQLAAEDLAAGKIDAIIHDDVLTAQLLKNNGNLKIAFILENPEDQELYGIVVRKDDSMTKELVNKGIAAIKAKGIDQKIYDKWFPKN